MRANACNISQIASSGGAGATVTPPGSGTTVAPPGSGATVAPPGAGAGATVTPQRPQGAVPAQGNPSLTFVNASGEPINENLRLAVLPGRLRAGPAGRERAVPPGQSLAILLPQGGGCLTILRVLYARGRAAKLRPIETCSIASLAWR